MGCKVNDYFAENGETWGKKDVFGAFCRHIYKKVSIIALCKRQWGSPQSLNVGAFGVVSGGLVAISGGLVVISDGVRPNSGGEAIKFL